MRKHPQPIDKAECKRNKSAYIRPVGEEKCNRNKVAWSEVKKDKKLALYEHRQEHCFTPRNK